jgi:hypothetical protein
MKFLHAVIAPLALSGAFMLAAAGPLRADDDCQKRTVHADHKLHEAIKDHGPDSPEARHWRQELAAARSWCWDHDHKWWDEDAHAWRSEHWDDHDHDH